MSTLKKAALNLLVRSAAIESDLPENEQSKNPERQALLKRTEELKKQFEAIDLD